MMNKLYIFVITLISTIPLYSIISNEIYIKSIGFIWGFIGWLFLWVSLEMNGDKK